MLYDVFISYSRKDSETANKIYTTLTSAGLSCFIDLEGISGGADFPSALAQAIMDSKLMLLVASKNFYASEYAMKEVTFAVNNKGSHFILPLIIDDAEFPKNLEFILSNINWRELSRSYRIERELLEDVQEKLADPKAGETLLQQRKRKTKITNGIIIGSLAATIILLMILMIPDSLENKKREQDYEKALAASTKSAQTIRQAQILLEKIDSLKKDVENREDTFYEEIALMDEADECVSVADSILHVYAAQPTYSYLFNGQTAASAGIAKQLTSKRDSMASSWRDVALSCYELYQDTGDSLDLVIAQEYVKKAVHLNPADSDLSSIQDNLSVL